MLYTERKYTERKFDGVFGRSKVTYGNSTVVDGKWTVTENF